MATSGLYGNTAASVVALPSGSETSGLYGNNTVFGGTYFEYFVFQDSATQPATPTGGSWSFTTNTGTPPTGWSNIPPATPVYKVWISIALVNSKSSAVLTWSVPGTTTGAATSGTVTSVGLSAPAFLSVSGSPVTTSGTLALSYSGTALPVANGGTGTTTPNLVAGSNVTITGTWPNQTINAAAGMVYPSAGIPLSTGSAWGTSYGTTGANSVVLRNANQNISVNSISEGYTNVAAAGTTTVLTVASAPNYVVTGSGGQTYQLPDATTLPSGVNYTFNNNQSSGTIVVKNNSSTTIATIQSGGFVDVSLLSNATAAGTWDIHNFAPSNVSWSTNTFDYAGSITSATWNGATVAVNRGGTGVTTSTGSGSNVLSTSPTLITPILGTPTSATLTNATGLPLTTGVTGLLPVANGGTGTATPALVAGTNVTITGTWPNQTINAAGGGGSGTVTSVAATVPSFLSVTGSPITTSGTLAISYSGTALPIANGGTGATSASAALTALGAYPSSNPSGYLSTLSTAISASNNGAALSYASGTLTIAKLLENISQLSGTGYIVRGSAGTASLATPVTSVGGTGTVSGLTLSGTVTSTGNLTLGGTLAVTPSNFASQTANTILAAPDGVAGTPTFRTLVAADIPTLNQNTTGTAANITATTNSTLTTLSSLSLPGSQVSGNISGNAANVTGTVAVANGGTGLTSLTANYIPYGNGTGAYSSSSQFQYNGTYLLTGAAAALGGLTNPVAAFTGNPGTTNYVQAYIYNAQNGASSSGDFVAYASNSTDAHGWADLGFTSPSYADAVYTVTGPNEAYLFGSALNSSYTGNLVYATDSTGSANAHQWYVGGFTQAKSAWKMQLTSTGLQLANALGVAYGGTGSTTLAGASIATYAGTETLTNKRINPRVLASTANSATPTINTDSYDMVVITGQSVAITSFTTNLTGTPVNGQKLWISVTGTTAIAITWGASFESSTATLPTTTVTTNRLDVGFVWNVATSKWRCVAVA